MATQKSSQPSHDANKPTGTGPVGEGDYVVRQGDCISSIAKEIGHFWQTLWDDPRNANLRQQRKSPSVLLPGDRVHIPALRRREEAATTEARHQYLRRGEPASVRIRVLKTDAVIKTNQPLWKSATNGWVHVDELNDKARQSLPRAREPYTLYLEGDTIEGTTNDDGELSVPITGTERRARLVVGTEGDRDRYSLYLGVLEPVESVRGLQQRLNNLGYACGKNDGIMGPKTRSALTRFQRDHELSVTRRADPDSRLKLLDLHGS